MKILVLGRVGQVGSALAELLAGRSPVQFLDQPEIDLAEPASAVAQVRSQQPDVVINAAAYTAVDKAQAEPELAHAINAQAPAAMAAACAEIDATIIHYSTDYVFDGGATEPYTEEAPVAPQSVYGMSKLAGEQAVQAASDRHIILRTAWLYSHLGQNFVKTMLRLAAAGKPLRVVADQVGSPTYAWDLAQATVGIVDALAAGREDGFGIFHATNGGVTSWHGFAAKLFELTGHDDIAVVPITTAEYPTPAPRPAYSVLSCARLKQGYGIELPDWQEALARCLARL